MDRIYPLLSAFSLLAVYAAYRWYCRRSISDIPGPKPASFWLGNYLELATTDCGVTESKWQKEFGNVARIKASFGEDQLWVADPKAVQHILQTSGYNYKRLSGVRVRSTLIVDRGVLWAEGDVHKRHRRVMLPAFGISESRAFLPLFRNAIDKVVNKWNDIIAAESSGKSTVLNIRFWLSKAALDAVGAAAFDYDFGAVDDVNNPLAKSYGNMMVAAFSAPSAGKIFLENIYNEIPSWILTMLYEYFPGAGVAMLHKNRAEVHKVAKELLKNKRNDLSQGKGKRDIMSLLLKANSSENEKSKLRDDEIIPQMRSILFAGHETTANAVTWSLYELAKRPEMQARMRTEIRETQVKIHARGDTDFTPSDFDSMPYTIAVMKETLRLNPVVFRLLREAVKDDVLPLFKPIVTRSGKAISEIPIPKGMRFYVSIIAYNTDKDIWGEDAHEFNPDRWLVPKQNTTPLLGAYGNILSFSSGVRNCIGWRFAVIEMQAFLISLLSNFEFAFADGTDRVRRDRAGVMVPMVEGDLERRSRLPLKVSVISS